MPVCHFLYINSKAELRRFLKNRDSGYRKIKIYFDPVMYSNKYNILNSYLYILICSDLIVTGYLRNVVNG